MHSRLILSPLVALLAVSCTPPVTQTEAEAGTGGDGQDLCADREGGAEIEIQVNDQMFRFWSTNAAFITQAKEQKGSGEAATASFGKLIDGTDCDTRWSFHVDSSEMAWPDVTTEVCDGRPADIEQDKAYWINNIKRWCPWSTKVLDVQERP
jgi:hypothetical protein